MQKFKSKCFGDQIAQLDYQRRSVTEMLEFQHTMSGSKYIKGEFSCFEKFLASSGGRGKLRDKFVY